MLICSVFVEDARTISQPMAGVCSSLAVLVFWMSWHWLPPLFGVL
jgi:hypothetical protein